MRLWTFCAAGSLATISAAALAQFAQRIDVMPIQKMILLRPVIVQPAPPPPPQAPQVQFRGCVYYEHANWGGKWRSIPGGTRRADVGPSWNDLISSYSCNSACRVVAFHDPEFKGARGEFPTTSAVPGDWNDKISSMIAVCQQPF